MPMEWRYAVTLRVKILSVRRGVLLSAGAAFVADHNLVYRCRTYGLIPACTLRRRFGDFFVGADGRLTSRER